MRRESRILRTAFWLTVVGGLAYANWRARELTVDVSPISQATTPASLPAGAAALSAEKPTELTELSETLARPLFNPARKPDAPAAETPPEPATVTGPPTPTEPARETPPPASLQLVGVMRSGATIARALIRPEKSSDAVWLEAGAEIGGWKVKSISDDHIVVEAGGQLSRLVLHPAAGANSAR